MSTVVAAAVFSTGPSLAAPAGCEDTDLYANPVSGSPALLTTPPECTFRSITDALEDALERDLGAGTRIILSGATASDPAVFRHERFPLAIPAGTSVTTDDDPDLDPGGQGLNPANYVVNFTGGATHAVELGGALEGVTFQNERARLATTMLVCTGGSAVIEAVTLDGTNRRGGTIGEGLWAQPDCELDASALRVRNFSGDGVTVEAGADLTLAVSKVHDNGGDGVTVAAGADLTLAASKVHDNSGDGLVIRGLASISTSEIAFNGDDGILVDSSGASHFEGNDVRDNGGNGFEVRTSGVSFLGNRIHNNSRSAGWDEPQMLFVGPALAGVQYWTGTEFVTAYPVGVPDGDCGDADTLSGANMIYSYDTSDAQEYSVGVYAEQGAHVWADNNAWRTGNQTLNVDQDASSVVDADAICGVLFQTDPDPGPPVE